MSEEILKALTRLFAIIAKQGEGVTESERDYVISFYQQELDSETVSEYVSLFDKYAEYRKPGEPEPPEEEEDDDPDNPKKKRRRKRRRKRQGTRAVDSVRVLAQCRKINKTLVQKQKVIVLFKILEMVAANREMEVPKSLDSQMEIIDTVANVFNVPKQEYNLCRAFVMEQHSSAESLNSEDILLFDDEVPAENSKIKYIDSGLLSGEIIFIRVQSVALYFTKYTGTDEIFLNGQLVKPNAILLFSNGSVFKTPKGAPLYYSDLVSTYNSAIEDVKLSFNVEDVEFRFPNGHVGLRNINLSEGAGRLIGIMGASGAGKTTLLNALAGLEIPYKGKVKINGYDIHDPEQKPHIEGVIGYISQDDLLIEELSVYQNLFYNAKLCFRDLSDEELDKRVVDVLASLGLDRIMDLKVGSVLNKKISGGQRKRLNIALELIREPSVLFVDEPTSGLSSRDSENVIDLLKELSLKGKLIFVVIHQPSSDIYKMFDKMWLMDTGGYPVFYGDPIEAITYFKQAAKQIGSDRGQCPTCGNVNPEQLFNIIEAQVVDEYGEFTNKRKITPPEWHDLYKKNFEIERQEDVEEEPPKNLKIPNKLKQTQIFTIRDMLSKIGNTQYMAINLLEAPALALLMSLIIRYKDLNLGEEYLLRYNDNIPAYILISIIVALFMGLSVSAEEIIADRKIKKREAFLNLSQTSYLASKLLILFAFSAVQTFSYVLIGNTILDINGEYITYWIVLFSISCFANVLGLNISSAFSSAITVYILIPLLLIPQMILSGAIFPFEKLNNTITEKGKVPLIADVWVSRWGYEAVMVEGFKHNAYEKLFYPYDTKESVANFKASFWKQEMERVLDDAFDHVEALKELPKEQQDSVRFLLEGNLMLIKNELVYENFVGLEELKLDEALTVKAFNADAVLKIKEYLENIKDYYTMMQTTAIDSRDSLMNLYKPESLAKLKNDYFSESMQDAVRKANTKQKIDRENGKLVQISDPIFTVPRRTSNPVDYRAHFFAPQKHLFGVYFDTYWFNIGIIWAMTILLYFTLYLELLRKAINFLGNVKFRK